MFLVTVVGYCQMATMLLMLGGRWIFSFVGMYVCECVHIHMYIYTYVCVCVQVVGFVCVPS